MDWSSSSVEQDFTMIPSRRRGINERNRRSKELEDSMNQKLEDLGLLEHGMSFKDKEDLLNIVRISENTAQAEEDERKSKITGVSSPGLSNDTMEDGDENRENEAREMAEPDLEITQVYFPSDVVMKLSSSLNKETDPKPSNGLEEAKPKLQEDQKSVSIEADSVEIEDDALTCEDKSGTGNHLLKMETCGNQSKSDHFSSFSSGKEQEEHTVSAPQNHDREESLDVFSHNQEPFLKTFCRSKLRKTQERIPFYLLQNGMDVHKYTAFFKCYVNEYLRRLYRNQRRRLEHLEWGPPICMEDSTVSGFKRQNLGEQNDSSRRYNFRDRMAKPKIIDFASENSDAEESNDEDIFTPRNRKLPGIKLSSKRKISLTNDVVSPKKEKKDVSSVLESKSFLDAGSANVSSKPDLDQDGSLIVTANDTTSCGVFNKKVPRTKLCLTSRKRNRRQGQSSSFQNKGNVDIVESSDITSTSELDMPVCADENIQPSSQDVENTELKPAALSAKHKKVLMTYDKSVRPLRRKADVENLREEYSNSEDNEATSQEQKVSCPICNSLFPAKSIEEHASDCNQYHPDASTNSSEVDRDKD